MENRSQEEIKFDIKSYLDNRYSRLVISNYYFYAQTGTLTMLFQSYNFSNIEGFLLRMKSCVGSPDEPLHEFLHIYTATVDYYFRLSDILHLMLDQTKHPGLCTSPECQTMRILQLLRKPQLKTSKSITDTIFGQITVVSLGRDNFFYLYQK